MKRTANILGIISVIMVSLGATAKVMHWPGAGWSLTLGILILVLLYAPLALMNNYKGTGKKALLFYLVIYLSVLIVFGGALFQIMNWPGDKYLMIISIPFPFVVFIPFLLYYARKLPSISMNRLIVVLLFMAYFGVTSAFLAIGLSRDILDEAVYLEKEYNKLNQHLEKVNGLLVEKSDFGESELQQGIIMDIEKLKKEIIMASEKYDERSDYYDLPGKDDYKPVSIVLHWSNPRVKELSDGLTNSDEYNWNEKLMPFYMMDPCEYLVTRVGNNPKIWALANLSLLEYQVNLNTNLHMKRKLLED